MSSIALNIAAFIVAIGVLVSVHEFGHFWVARRLGVKVLRFSIGFGRPLWTWRGQKDATEYVLAAIPLGGYVKMLDEREGEVDATELDRAFNRKSLLTRSAVVVAGPLFNFLFAIAAFWAVLIIGETGLRPLIGDVAPDSAAARAQFRADDEILSINDDAVPTWSAVYYRLAAAALSDQPIRFRVRDDAGEELDRIVNSDEIGDPADADDLLEKLGLAPQRPVLPPVLGEIVPGEAASAAGLQTGDRIISADTVMVDDWLSWVEYIQARPGELIRLEVERDGQTLQLDLIPAELEINDKVVGRIGAGSQRPEGLVERYLVVHQMGVVEAFPAAVAKTWEFSTLTLKVMGRIITGEASIKNLSGPITIADTAGRTASIGLVYFLKFLAIVSVSLGVLNLLPVPVLDGGHLMFFLLEAIKGKPLSEEFMLHAQRVGMVLLLGLMMLAFYVDISRLHG